MILCASHSIIGTLIFRDNQYTSLSPQSYWVQADRTVFFFLISFYLFAHLLIALWYYFVPFAERRRMRELDRRYQSMVRENLTRARSHSAILIIQRESTSEEKHNKDIEIAVQKEDESNHINNYSKDV